MSEPDKTPGKDLDDGIEREFLTKLVAHKDYGKIDPNNPDFQTKWTATIFKLIKSASPANPEDEAAEINRAINEVIFNVSTIELKCENINAMKEILGLASKLKMENIHVDINGGKIHPRIETGANGTPELVCNYEPVPSSQTDDASEGGCFSFKIGFADDGKILIGSFAKRADIGDESDPVKGIKELPENLMEFLEELTTKKVESLIQRVLYMGIVSNLKDYLNRSCGNGDDLLLHWDRSGLNGPGSTGNYEIKMDQLLEHEFTDHDNTKMVGVSQPISMLTANIDKLLKMVNEILDRNPDDATVKYGLIHLIGDLQLYVGTDKIGIKQR